MRLADREREYSPSSCIGGNYQPYIRAYAERSAAARQAHPPLTLRYGMTEAQALDLFVPAGVSRPPVLVFFHGGYWQELSKQDSAFAAPCCLARGIAYAAVGYTLAPKVTLDEIVAECCAAVTYLAGREGTGPLVLAGSSAGAHLAAMVALAAPEAVKAAILVSGVYDLAPLIGTSIDQALHLDPAMVARNSPLLLPLERFPRSLVCWGEIETGAFKQQSGAFARALRAAGARCADFEIPGRNHFDVILDLAERDTLLGRQALDLMV